MAYADSFATAYLSDQTAASAVGMGAAVNTVRPARFLGANPWVQCRMSVSGATCVVTVVLHSESDGSAPIGVAAPGSQTATATTLRDSVGSGDYWSQILAFSAANAPFYEVRIAAPSSGNVDVYTWST